jgi:ornithine cyclodeaminase/alanine dehydrogenase-like protein (mu-crystallin family)
MALVLREKDVRSLLTMRDTVLMLDEAFNALSQGIVLNEPRTRLTLSNGNLNILAAAVPSLGVIGFKTYTTFRDGVRFMVMLFSAVNGQLLALIEADWLGSMRTGAASAVATKHLARTNVTTVGLIGSGNQAMTQLMGMLEVRPTLSCVYVYSRHSQGRELFCKEMRRMLEIDVIPVESAREAVEQADILITATTSSDPVLYGEWLKAGCHINAIGSNWAQKREIDTATLQLCSIIVTDSVEQAYKEAGDFIIPAHGGLFDWDRVLELSDVVGENAPPRLPEDITLYKGLGVALEDIVTATGVYRMALSQGLGEKLDILP